MSKEQTPENVEFLNTKFEIPNLSYKIVRRTRLTSLLFQQGEKRVSLVVAPAGYGKTTLLCEWLSFFSTAEHRSVWLNLDLFDNSPIRFWSYVIRAISKVIPQFKFSQENIHFLMFDKIDYFELTPLINEIGKQSFLINLIFDDFHNITNSSILESMEFLIEHQPRNLHIILSTRNKPELPLSKIRLTGRLTELTAKDLAFSKIEIDSYMSNLRHILLSIDQITDLYQVTHGWPAGLQMASITLDSYNKYPDDMTLELLNRYEFPDYISEEVLTQQNEETREFLLKISILEAFSASLCNALLNKDNSQEIIDQLIKNNLFITEIDSNQKWYRFHRLFSEALYKQLKKRMKDQLPHLHETAMNWLIENGYPEKAVVHAIKTNHLQKAADIIDHIANTAIANHDVSKLILWIDANVDSLLEYRPRLGIYYATALFLLSQFTKVNAVLDKTVTVLQKTDFQNLMNEDRDIIEWEIMTMRLTLKLITGSYESNLKEAEKILNDHSKENLYLYGALTNTMGIIYDNLGELDKALKYYDKGADLAIKSNFQFGYWQTKCAYALCHYKKFQYREAIKILEQIVNYIHQNHLDENVLLLVKSFLLEIYLEQNDILKAELLAKEITEIFKKVNLIYSDYFYITNYALFLADYLITTGNLTEARHYLELANDKFPKLDIPKFLLPIEIIEVYVRLLRTEAQANQKPHWYKNEDNWINPVTLNTFTGKIARARILQDQNNHKGAVEFLRAFLGQINKSEFSRLKIEAQILLSISEFQIGEKETAFSLIQDILQICSEQNGIRIFLNESGFLNDLLCEYLGWIEVQNISQKEVIKAFISTIQQATNSPCEHLEYWVKPNQAKVTSIFVMNEPFSPREEEVFNLLVLGNGYKEIAELLTISMNTTRTHIKNIYRKLDVHSQKMLITRAVELGLI